MRNNIVVVGSCIYDCDYLVIKNNRQNTSKITLDSGPLFSLKPPVCQLLPETCGGVARGLRLPGLPTYVQAVRVGVWGHAPSKDNNTVVLLHGSWLLTLSQQVEWHTYTNAFNYHEGTWTIHHGLSTMPLGGVVWCMLRWLPLVMWESLWTSFLLFRRRCLNLFYEEKVQPHACEISGWVVWVLSQFSSLNTWLKTAC